VSQTICFLSTLRNISCAASQTNFLRFFPRAENPKIAVTEISKQIGAKWQEVREFFTIPCLVALEASPLGDTLIISPAPQLDEDGKQPYNDKAGVLKAEYLVKLEEFEQANPE